MTFALAAFALAPGLAVGSFLNVVAARLPLGRSVATPRSACMHCATEIRARDNVPVISYLVLRGRCHSCRAPIGLRYPAVELATAVLAAVSVIAFGPTLHALAAGLLCAALVCISATDIEHGIVPNRVVLPAAVAVLALQLVWHPTIQWPAAGLGAGLFLFLVALAYPSGMGAGDAKVALLIGFGVGRSAPVAIFLGMLAALVPSIVMLARHGVAARKMKIPFAPFLALGGVVALFAGNPLLDWYLRLL